MSEVSLRIRAAYPRELSTLVEFNRAMARETEGKELDPERSHRGVEGVFTEPSRGIYYVALRGEELVGALLLTYEWSDWRNGVFWWIQSVYVLPSARRAGVFRALYQHVLERARANPDVSGLRLYVDHSNERAQRVYANLGMQAAHYRMFEVDFVLGGERAPDGK